MNEVWALINFPFDNHLARVHVENSAFDASRLVVLPDRENSRLGADICLLGWNVAHFAIAERTQIYKSSYGSDVSQHRDAESSHSRLTVLALLEVFDHLGRLGDIPRWRSGVLFPASP